MDSMDVSMSGRRTGWTAKLREKGRYRTTLLRVKGR